MAVLFYEEESTGTFPSEKSTGTLFECQIRYWRIDLYRAAGTTGTYLSRCGTWAT
jgi:hypothetical protein